MKPHSSDRQRGAILVFFVFALLAMLLAAGLVVDLGLAYVGYGWLVRAVDAGALAGARNAASTNAEMESMIRKVAGANFRGPLPVEYDVQITIPEVDTKRIAVSGRGKSPAMFSRLAGFDTFALGAEAEAIRYPLDLSLVLDVSLSLQNNNVFDDMQRAAVSFLDHFDDQVDQIGLVTLSHWAVDKATPAKGNNASLKTLINRLDAVYYTNIEEGLRVAKDNLAAAPARSNAIKVVVLFTDGRSTAFRDSLALPRGTVPATYDGVVAARYGTSSSNFVGLFQHADGRKITRFSSSGAPTLATYNSSSASPRPTSLPGGKSLTGANVETIGSIQSEAWANEIRKTGALVYTIALGNPNARNVHDTPDLDFLRRVANDRGIVDANQPAGLMVFAPTAADLEEMFARVADRILTRLTR
jgi:hypothetical protein